jgi:FlaA1/EpsC-like NDP-sugar epimerase
VASARDYLILPTLPKKMTSHKKNLLVTGGAGFIGSNFIN